MTAQHNFPLPHELGLVPGLGPAELRRVYRQLVREYHPDSGSSGSDEVMQYINALHDELKKHSRTESKPASGAQSPADVAPARKVKPAAKRKKARSRAERIAPKPPEDPVQDCLGELSLTQQAREIMSKALIDAVDTWLVSNRGVPRNALRRRMLVRIGRIGPVSCPGLHMPDRVSMAPNALRFHFASSPVEGLNLVALPALSNDGIRLSPTGDVSVLEEPFDAGQASLTLAPDWVRENGFDLTYGGRHLPVKLEFQPGESNYSTSLYALPGERFRGVFSPATHAP